ncbi:YheC/YheD family endospore coat-associated protein [Bacillus sp. FJAT-45350]|uniref:YheC/YheD family endospore coat-associated protein n=1 Tax=Bacillus sp. FJAT-45350 TaxID=2011014 RepID=UPI000BB9869B|nr:YheC/YheD family protein [Bacillus sp. FJAT-45350]
MISFQRVSIQSIDDSLLTHQHEIRLSEKLFKTWKLNLHQVIPVVCGNKKVDVECMPLDQNDELILQCSSSLLQELNLPEKLLSLHLSYHKELLQFQLGPIISVLTLVNQNRTDEPFGTVSKFCEELADYAKMHHLFFYVFSIQQWDNEKPKGYIFEDGQWDEVNVPIPDVIYNRIGSRKVEQSTNMAQLLTECSILNIPYFNEKFLSKWDVYSTLHNYIEIKPHLPTTELYTDEQSLKTMLDAYSLLFLKPDNGSQGKGIYQIGYDEKEDQYFIRYSTLSGKQERIFQSTKVLHSLLSKRIGKRSYLLQEAIPLKKWKDRPLDFRILCCRTLKGEWNVISAVARVSAEEKFVANLAQGGEIVPVDEVLLEWFPTEESKQLKSLLYEIALESSRLLNEESTGEYGEFGVDIGIDEEGFPWIIELNTKPSKNDWTVQEKKKIRPSAKTVIQFAFFLSKFPYTHLR